ncbi:MAG: type II secretion system F family protein [Desulfobacterium sp.]|nr:type II secretion system F family protein [Desulfobacterium sp.]MBU3948636.1 type II secretion system F family protein [Pseudomonadota bacterium]MBU4011655.1 type II secretion system F family protein [Pseudomonadota bacterium]MBU4036938.1 type II secretion system F family protein [Pseudomonadota bacterium]
MPNYKYKAVDNKGALQKGTVFANSDKELEKRLSETGLTLINSRREGMGSKILLSESIKPRILIEFYYRLSQTLELGLPVISALEENEKIIPSKYLRKIVGELKTAIEGGNSIHEGMSRFPKVFQKLDIGIIRMGEQTGTLPVSMKRLAEFLEWKEDIRSTTKRATIYPTFVILSLVGVIAVWVGYVLPRMAGLLNEMGVPLPAVTRAVLSISIFFKDNWLYILACFALFVISFLAFGKTKQGKIYIHQYMLKVPVLGLVATNIAMARLSQNFATMYSAGMSLHNVFEILTDNILGNRYIEGQLKIAYENIMKGQTISDGFEKARGFPPLLLGSIRNGETTGTLDVTFARLGNYYNNEVKRSVQTLINLMEPLSIVFLGGAFGLIALSIMLPLYDVISQFK